MKTLFLGLIFSMVCLVGLSQKEYNDLKILYADGNYEKLVKEAEKYTASDKTKSDPIPYIWLARGLYKISTSSEVADEFKNAFKDALGAIAKFIKNDKDGSAMADSENLEFVELLQVGLLERISNDIDTKNYRKAFGWVSNYKKISKNTLGSQYLEAACKFRNDDKSSAFTMWRDCETAAAKITSQEGWSETDIAILKLGVLESAECYVSVKQVEKAKKIVNTIMPWFEEDEEFKDAVNEVLY